MRRGIVFTRTSAEYATEEDHAQWLVSGRRKGWQVTANGNLDTGQTSGLCARCQASCEVYGPNGNPLCDGCRGVADSTEDGPR